LPGLQTSRTPRKNSPKNRRIIASALICRFSLAILSFVFSVLGEVATVKHEKYFSGDRDSELQVACGGVVFVGIC